MQRITFRVVETRILMLRARPGSGHLTRPESRPTGARVAVVGPSSAGARYTN